MLNFIIGIIVGYFIVSALCLISLLICFFNDIFFDKEKNTNKLFDKIENYK